jgi:hypothetical protein
MNASKLRAMLEMELRYVAPEDGAMRAGKIEGARRWLERHLAECPRQGCEECAETRAALAWIETIAG